MTVKHLSLNMVSGPDMTNRRRVLRTFLVFAGLVLVVPASPSQISAGQNACEGDCVDRLPSCQATWQTNISAVFLGRATELHKEDMPVILDGQKQLTERKSVTFKVDEAFVGVSERIVTVTSGGDLCGFPFSKGHEYLVYGRRLPSGEVYVSICSSTKSEKDAAEDLKYLRGIPTAPHGATIYGTAFRYIAPDSQKSMLRPGTPETGHKIEVQGIGQNYEVIVDGRGNFSLAGVPPGQYTIVLNADGAVHTSPPLQSRTVNVKDKGCAVFNFWIDPFAKKEPTTSHDGISSPVKEPNKD